MSQIFPIEDDPRFRILTASAGQVAFAIPFPFQANADIKALARIDDEFVEIPGGYSITGAGNPSGGTLTFAEGRTENEDILILGSAVLERLTSIVLNGRFTSAATDNELDRNRIIQQEVKREVDRAVKTSYGETAPTIDLGIPDGAVLIKQGPRLTAGPTAGAINSAETFAQQATSAAGAASDAAGLAVGAAETSVNARNLAQQWANNPENSVVEGGLYSAFHWAKKAAQVVLDGLVDLSVSTAKIADLAVITAKIADLAVITAKIANGAVTQAKLAADIVSGWSAKASIDDADQVLIGDSAASNVAKKTTFTHIWTWASAKILTLFNVSGSAPVYACRAWANFSGMGSVVVRGSGNVLSIGRSAAGLYTITFLQNMPNANYTVAGLGRLDSVIDARIPDLGIRRGSIPTVSNVQIQCTEGTTTASDCDYVTVNIHC